LGEIIVGSGKRFADPEKVRIIHEMTIRETKTELRQMLGFFSFSENTSQNVQKLQNHSPI